MAMTCEQYYLTRIAEECAEIAEECAEVARRASKAAIFGLEEVQPGQPYNNLDRMLLEYEDLKVVIARALEVSYSFRSSLSLEDLNNYRFNKRLRLIKYEEYSRQQGQVE